MRGTYAIIHWQSCKIKRIVISSLTAECLALQEASEAALYLKAILEKILQRTEGKI